jgi:DoxX-like protein
MNQAAVSKGALWAGYICGAAPVLMLLFSGVMKLIKPAPVVVEFGRLGYPEKLTIVLGIIELACTVIYIIPRTAILGAILLTAYLGGATATHVRIGDPFFIPIVLGILIWLGLYFRDPRLRPLMPLTKG